MLFWFLVLVLLVLGLNIFEYYEEKLILVV